METAFIKANSITGLSLKEVMATFFDKNSPESVRFICWKLFQCWATKECNLKAEISDEELALFFDQLIDLVAAAHIVHQANRVVRDTQKGKDHD